MLGLWVHTIGGLDARELTFKCLTSACVQETVANSRKANGRKEPMYLMEPAMS